MARKEKVDVRRDESFAEMDELLSDALAGLEASNERVEQILNREEELESESEPDTKESVEADEETRESAGESEAAEPEAE